MTKDISLTPHFDEFVEDKVRSGRYRSASEVVRESLRMMEAHDAAIAETREKIEAGWQQSERRESGDGEPFTEQLREELMDKVTKQLVARRAAGLNANE